jgi:cytochrome d ubiquinol oxidase subunit I
MPPPPTELLFARGQMAYSLGFHIVFAAVGVAMPVLMVGAELMWRRTGQADYLALAKRWARGTAVLFAIGAVSGTALSFELGLLFPGFMRHAGPLVGLPFSLEGFAFFTEAIFLGLYLYGRDKLAPALHLACGALVAASGLASAAAVLLVNAWMNAPTGFRLEGGALVDLDPLAALATPYAFHVVLHGVLACYATTSLAVGAIHAYGVWRQPGASFHRRALGLALAMTIPVALAQPLVGHHAGQVVARHQPVKLAAMEGHRSTMARAPIVIGPFEIPGGLSWMAFGDRDAVVVGLDDVPPADRPPAIVKPAFLAMVGLGTAAAGYAALAALALLRRRRVPTGRAFLAATIALGPAGAIAMEAGWIVTEVGRQPWVIHGVLRTADAATPVGGLWLPFVGFAAIYLGLAAVVALVLVREIRAAREPAP